MWRNQDYFHCFTFTWWKIVALGDGIFSGGWGHNMLNIWLNVMSGPLYSGSGSSLFSSKCHQEALMCKRMLYENKQAGTRAFWFWVCAFISGCAYWILSCFIKNCSFQSALVEPPILPDAWILEHSGWWHLPCGSWSSGASGGQRNIPCVCADAS